MIGPESVSAKSVGRCDEIDRYRFAVKPGLIFSYHHKQEKGILSGEEDMRIKLDYIEDWNLLTDCKVLMKFMRTL
jgi:lipopolysaccharide/colanic/teichoic acid biosynthesis glycosyltransferase